jgi:HEAT repeat protein
MKRPRPQLFVARLIAALCIAALGRSAVAADATTAPSVAPPVGINWLTSLDAADLQAQRTQQPILLFIESGGDLACQQAVATLQACVAASPNDWVIAQLDLRNSRDALPDLGVSTVPAIRMLAPSGRLVASLDQPMTSTSISQWLLANRAAAMPAQSPTDSSTRQQLLAQLGGPDATMREMAVRRLSSDRAAAADVIGVLFSGSMAARLAALDLLEQWGAPIATIDPWDRSTLTEARRTDLLRWAKSPPPMPTSRPAPPGQSDDAGLDVEFDELLSAPTAADARAVREQFIRFGAGILPAISLRLSSASDDAARQRLTALRYRIVATDRLAADWPGGFDRLASSDPFVRRAAVDELSQHVTNDDSRLLVELFTNQDEFVRERCLKMLRAVGGPQANQALMKLLQDPEPNVRAAVLKTLAQTPDPSLAPDLVRYTAVETDPDLVVHAIKVLQDIPGDSAGDGLKNLLSHPQWRVRAEACAAIHQKLQGGESMSPQEAASLIPPLSKCLDDADNFVVSQAAAALILFHLSPADQAVLRAIDRHPELAVDLLTALGRDRNTALMLLPALVKLTSHANPQIRAQAIRAVCVLDPRNAGAALGAGLKDQDATVRRTAALGMVTVLDAISPQDGTIFLEPDNYQTALRNVDARQWVTAFVQGRGRPGWMSSLKPDLQRLVKDPDEQTSTAAAVALCALGSADEAAPVLQKTASSKITAATEAAALPFLDWDQRKELFDKLLAITPDGQMSQLIDKFAMVADSRAAQQLWNLLGDPPRDVFFSAVHRALLNIYGLTNQSNFINGLAQPGAADKPALMHDATPMLQMGTELQRTEALCLIFGAQPDAAVQPAKAILANTSNTSALRNASLQILLLALPEADAQALAVSQLPDQSTRRTAVSYLAIGSQAASRFRGDVYLNAASQATIEYGGFGQADPIIHVRVPAGLQLQPLTALMNDSDPDIAGYAGYLAALLGERRGMESLLKAARAHGFESDWASLVYRAITKLDDDSQTPVLEEIYKSFGQQKWLAREFYWTIRAMHGPNILKLRKRIRDEVGMDQLR